MSEKETYFTSDFALACALLCKDFLLKSISDAENPKMKGRKFFNFDILSIYKENAHDIAKDFYANKLQVDPMQYNSYQRMLKAKLRFATDPEHN